MAQARSLQTQHDRFCALHAEDRFSLQYMQWLVHHEFGADHRPMGFRDRAGKPDDGLAYWIGQWCQIYGTLLETAPDQAIFV